MREILFKAKRVDNGECIRKDLGYWINMIDTVPVGNIFDNSELLQEE